MANKGEIDKDCLNLTRGRLCSIRHFPSYDSQAFKDMTSDAQKEPIENGGYKDCEVGAFGCRTKYAKSN